MLDGGEVGVNGIDGRKGLDAKNRRYFATLLVVAELGDCDAEGRQLGLKVELHRLPEFPPRRSVRLGERCSSS